MQTILKIIYLISVLFCCKETSFSQNFSTTSDNCPIIRGVEAKVNYFSEQRLDIDLPEDIANYLSGLLIINNYNQNNYESAVSAWLSKYNTLFEQIENSKRLNEIEKKETRQFLENGDFEKVAEILQLNTTEYTRNRLFSSISTTGANSPIIIGDYSNVTYVIKKIIKFDLPESLTPVILKQISDGNQLITELRSSISSKDAIIQDWVKAYKELEVKIAELPKYIATRANEAFHKGDFELTISIIEELQQSEQEIANARYLKAKILLLDFKVFTEEAYNEIVKSFNISFTLAPSYQNCHDFGEFLINYYDYYSALAPLSQSVSLASNLSEQAFSLNHLGLAQYYSGTNYIKGVENMTEAAKKFEILLDGNVDSLVFDQIININLNLAYIYAVQDQIDLYDSYLKKSLHFIEKMKRHYSAIHQVIYYHSFALQIIQIRGNIINFDFHLNEVINNIRPLLEKDENYYGWYLGSIYESAGYIYLSQKDYENATVFFENSKNIYRNYIGPSHIGALTAITPIYRKLVDLYSLQKKYTSMDSIINEFQKDIQEMDLQDSMLIIHYNQSASALKGNYYRDIGEKQKASTYLVEAFDYFTSNISQDPYIFTDLSIINFNKLLGLLSSQEKYKECTDLAIKTANEYGKHRTLDSVYFARYQIEAYNHATLYSLYFSSEDSSYIDTSLFYSEQAIKEFKNIVMKYPNSLYFYYENIISIQSIAIEKTRNYEKAIAIHEEACQFLEDIMKYNSTMVPTCMPLYAEQKISLAHTLLLHKPDVNHQEVKNELDLIMMEIDVTNAQNNYTYYYYYIFLAKYYNLQAAMSKKRDKGKYENLRCEYFDKSTQLLENLKFIDLESALNIYYDFGPVCN